MSVTLADWNGEVMPLEDVKVSVLDRGFLFGDGIYEALRVYGGKPFLLREHMDRLKRSLKEVSIDADVDAFEKRTLNLLAKSGIKEGLIYQQVTRGVYPRVHKYPPKGTKPNELVWVKEFTETPFAEFRESGAAVVTVPDLRWKRCDIKSINLLGNCMAAEAAAQAGCQEALLIAEDGSIVEGSHTSAFGVKDGRVWTMPLGPNILPGITRALVLKLANRANIEVIERSLLKSELGQIDELFLTGTTSEVLPVTKVDGHGVGTGKAGPVTLRLVAEYQKEIDELVRS
ncbi:D-alanine aminotransferase [Caulifigura coniformis]|uniref:D-alanine aminotransferase n=1 Tax=Caulifigura coniformis TaxID=2527983 RepID=A0A517SB08_9PLAN|nr:aminotransferase class IV [Caulifigura coniformis]QDT53312.1 D-alanine aminotransferase [Caulifigura coniformis]